MSLTKAEVRAAFREVAVRSYAHIPPDEEINHIFSESFYRRMDALIEEQQRGSWRLMSRRRRRTLLIAAILAVTLLLTACTPALREAVTEFMVSIYEKFVDYGTQTALHDELEVIYVLNPVPEGFDFVSQTQHSTHFVETIYQDSHGIQLKLSQAAFDDIRGFADNQHGETLVIEEDTLSIFIYSSEEFTTASWVFDGYYMNLSYLGQLENNGIVSLISTLSLSE